MSAAAPMSAPAAVSAAALMSAAASAAPAVVSMGALPPECAIREHFEDAPSLQAVVRDAQEPALPRSQWERDMERRVASSERMLQQIHTMVMALHPAPAAGSAPAALGSAAQVTAGQGPGTPEWGHAFPVQLVETNHPAPEQPLPFGYGANDNVAPWPTADFMHVPGNEVLWSLPRATQELMASCASVSLPLHARIPDALTAKIWAGEFIDLSRLIKPDQLQQHDYGLSVQVATGSPTFCVSPAKAKPSETLSFPLWMQAFQMYMSVYLTQPANLPCATKMLKYIEVVRGLAQEGADWRSYDQVFRCMRYRAGWAWDPINWELWLKASQTKADLLQSPGSPFPGKGRARPPTASPCFAFNRGDMCNKNTCRWMHKCRVCGGSHPSIRCFSRRAKQQRPGNTPPPGPPAGPSTATDSPAWARK